jgi:hypothetical protein
MTTAGLAKADSIRLHFGWCHKIGKPHRGEGQPPLPESNRGRPQTASAGHSVSTDAAVLDINPGPKLIGKTDGIRSQERFDIG